MEQPSTHEDLLKKISDLEEKIEIYQVLVENSADLLYRTDLQGRITFISSSVYRLSGYTAEEAVGMRMAEEIYLFPEARAAFLARLNEKGHVTNFEAQLKRKDGSVWWASTNAHFYRDKTGEIAGVEGITRDISDKKRMARQLQETQRFEAIATLAGGVAHDFNNLLMGIQGRISLVAADLDRSHPHAEHLQAVEEYIRTATDLTKQLLGFARGGLYEVKATNLNDFLTNSAAMFGRTKKEIQIHTNLREPSPVVEIDRSQIGQVLLNLFVNAWQAMPHGGNLYLESRIVRLDAADCKPHHAEPGRYARLSITDTGIGMDEATRRQIFDPFFTTKGKGRGTGLGLASAYGIIKNHHGFITAYSEVGHGATFNIYLPLSDKAAYQEDAIPNGIIKGSGTVLLIDDEEMILTVGRALLEKLGYRVLVASGGKQGLEVLKREGGDIDLIVLDLIMPGMSGSQVFDAIRAIRPRIPVLLSSGYSMNGQTREILEKGCNGFLQKPFNLSELSQKIDQVLE